MVAAVTASGERGRTQALRGSDELRNGEALEAALELVRGAEGELAHLAERLDARPTSRALGHDEDADGLDRTVSALGPSMGPARLCRPGRLERVEGIGLAALTPGLAVLAVHFDDVNPGSGEEPGDAGPIGARPLHTDLADLPKGLEPAQQLGVAVGVSPKRLRAEQATDFVQDGGHVDLPMGVDATGDGAGGFYDGHAIPSFP